ncbi:MAG: 4Fe-4S dicluster domain-containing protein [Chloroflexota bacterium]
MFKHTISELKEAMVCLEAGQVTLGYPFVPHAPDANFRGKVKVDTRKCMGCGACANACPSRLIVVTDNQNERNFLFELGRCTYCAACRDACPQEAIALTSLFELATPDTNDLRFHMTFRLARCIECGAPINTERVVDVARERLLREGGEHAWLDACPSCRRKAAAQARNHRMEAVA